VNDEVCGNRCYDKNGYFCCFNSGEICLHTDQQCKDRCATSTTPTSPPVKETCISRAPLCPNNTLCCDDAKLGPICYDPTNQTCVDGRVLCPANSDIPARACGLSCYNPFDSECCDPFTDKICRSDDPDCIQTCSVPCGPSSNSPVVTNCPRGQLCCNDLILGPTCFSRKINRCSRAERLCDLFEDNCGVQCFDPKFQICCDPRKGTVCHRKDFACQRRCPSSDGPKTTDPAARPNSQPLCNRAVATPEFILNPNHQFVDIDIFVPDPDGDEVVVKVTGIFQDEKPKTGDQGDVCPDARGVNTRQPEVVAERRRSGDGRAYTLFFEAWDNFGGKCRGFVVVFVPNNGKAINGGPLFDSTDCT